MSSNKAHLLIILLKIGLLYLSFVTIWRHQEAVSSVRTSCLRSFGKLGYDTIAGSHMAPKSHPKYNDSGHAQDAQALLRFY